MAAPDHVAWLEDTGEVIETADGREAEIWVLQHADDAAILSAWATHYRQHYCRDEDLSDLVADTGLSNADFLTNIKFPDAVAAPGPSTRAGDFGEILVADFIEYVLGYWCPRQGRFEFRENRNVPSNGTDVIGFSFAGDEQSPDDELLVIESKAGFRPTTKNRLQQAINDSGKDLALADFYQRLHRTGRLRVPKSIQYVFQVGDLRDDVGTDGCFRCDNVQSFFKILFVVDPRPDHLGFRPEEGEEIDLPRLRVNGDGRYVPEGKLRSPWR